MKRKWVKLIVAVILILLIGAVGFGIYRTLESAKTKTAGGPGGHGGPPGGGFPGGPPGGGQTETPVRVEKTAEGNVSTSIRVNGDVVAKIKVDLHPVVSGKLVSRSIDLGDYVKKDDTVAFVDPSRPGETYTPSAVTSTISGTVISVPVQVGDTVSTQTTIATIGVLSDLQIQTYIPERFITFLRKGLYAAVSFEAFPDKQFQARVTELSPVLDPASRTLEIKLEMTRPDPRIRAGMFATIELVTNSRRNVLAIPREAILSYYGDSIVYVVGSGNKVTRRTVKTGLEGEKLVEITEGLKEGEQIVIQGQNFLNDGDTVRIIE